MNPKLKIAFYQEISHAKQMIRNGSLSEAFHALERAHILGQKYVIPHTISHLWMLKVAFQRRDLKEIWGQLIRIPLGIIGSSVGTVPLGNTGGSNVSAFKKMEISPELRKLLDD